MNLPDNAILLPLLVAGGHAIILALLSRQDRRQNEQMLWLIRYLFIAIVWQLLLIPSPLQAIAPNLPIIILLVGTLALGMTTAAYVNWPHQRQWLRLGGLAVGATLIVDLLWPGRLPGLSAAFPFQATIGSVVGLVVWLVLSLTLLLVTWRSYLANQMPWHANRLLYWAVTLLITFSGELLLFFTSAGLAILGLVLRLLGIMGLSYGVYSHRLFDVRTRLRMGLNVLLITAVTAAIGVGMLMVIIHFMAPLAPNQQLLLLFVLTSIGFLLYQPFRRQVEWLVRRFVPLERFDTGSAIRSYNQAISQTLDVDQLSLLIITTLSEMFDTNRGALILLTETNGNLELDPIPALGRVVRQKVQFARDSVIFANLTRQRQPLLQYELDFNPEFRTLTPDERRWLHEQEMDVYVPIQTAQELNGLIALGPKSSGRPFRANELQLVQMLADQTVIALQNARLYSELGAHNEQIRQLNADLRQQNRRLEIMDKVKSDFIAIASHELRTPLTQVKGYADILASMNEEHVLTQEQIREIIGHIARAAGQLDDVISAMLDASQIDVNAMRLTFVDTRLETIIRLAMEPLDRAIRQRRLNLTLDGIQDMPTIRADFKRLVQAFNNLIGNAVKYTPDGGTIVITAVQLPSQEPETDYLEIVVADTGIGIDPKYHQLIFEKFFRVGDPQLHSTSSTKFKGAGPGLGLPIARGVIEAHGGRIWVESEGEDENRLPGSKFGIILPVIPPQARDLLPEQSQWSEQSAWLIG